MMKIFVITTIISLILVIGLLLLTNSFPSGSYSSDSYVILWFFVILSIVFGLIAGTYKYNKLKKESGVDNEKKLSAKEEFKIQIENYDNLGITKSSRGKASLVMGFFIILTCVFAFLGVFSMTDALGALIIYVPLTYFVYKGYRWAIIGTMIMWTLDKIYQIGQAAGGKSIIGIIFWWIFLISLLYQALDIENQRVKIKNKIKDTIKEDTNAEVKNNNIGKLFCSNCGKELLTGGKFCKYCGKQLN